MTAEIPTLLFVGPLRMEYFLLPDGKSHPRIPGGPALYAAAGARPWTRDSIGLVSRVGKNFSPQTVQEIRSAGIGTAGIRLLPDSSPSLGFHYYETWEKHIDWDPVKYYIKYNRTCPDELLEYSPPSLSENAAHPLPETAVRAEDIPAEYHQACAAYIAPCHYQSQITLSVALRRFGVGTLVLSPPDGMLLPSFRPQMREVLHGVDILFTRESSLQTFFSRMDADAGALSERIARWGPKIVLLQRGNSGIHVYDSETRSHNFIPFYPVEMRNPLAIGDSFCGGFLATWRAAFNPVESALAGCISASLAMEGPGGLYALERNPGLAGARLASLRRSILS
ncbi:MAG: carbohydrate kinase family protein [Anaerolineales bacterium]|nr:carbohydrate kinase family protein [Anaerolineales bacterium]